MRSTLLEFWGLLAKPQRAALKRLVVLMLLTSVAEVAGIGAVLPFLAFLTAPDQIAKSELAEQAMMCLGLKNSSQLVVPVTVGFISAALSSGAMRILLLWAQTKISYAIGVDISTQAYERTLYQSYVTHTGRNSSEVIAAISNKAQGISNSTILPLLLFCSSAVLLIAILGVLAWIDAPTAFSVLCGFSCIYGLIALATRRRLRLYSERSGRESVVALKALQEGLGGIRDVILDGSQRLYVEHYRSSASRLSQSVAGIQIIGGMPRFLIESLGMIMIACAALWLTENGQYSHYALPILGALALGAQRLLPLAQQLYQSWAIIRGSESALVDVMHLLKQPMQPSAGSTVDHEVSFQSSIRLENAWFRYSDQGPWVLQDVNLDIKKGDRIGFIGKTGNGKSTLLDVVMGLLSLNEGLLKIDGQKVSEDNVRGWQLHLAHVPQFVFLADATIKENIAFGIPPSEIDLGRVEAAALNAQLHSVIDSLPERYETIIGERGIRLSGGQRQRLGIARALYKRADVIVLDEATSALDEKTEAAVMHSIETLSNKITIIIVAHRITTLRGCDQIIELENGHLKTVQDFV